MPARLELRVEHLCAGCPDLAFRNAVIDFFVAVLTNGIVARWNVWPAYGNLTFYLVVDPSSLVGWVIIGISWKCSLKFGCKRNFAVWFLEPRGAKYVVATCSDESQEFRVIF